MPFIILSVIMFNVVILSAMAPLVCLEGPASISNGKYSSYFCCWENKTKM